MPSNTPASIFQPRPQLTQTTVVSSLQRAEPDQPISNTPGSSASTHMVSLLRNMPPERYVGSFGVVGWATKSGMGLLKHNEKVAIERSKIQPKQNKAKRVINLKKQDVVVRFTNERGEEVGRL
jgi:DNA repair protein RAD5